MTYEKHLSDTELEAVAGGLGNLWIGGNAGLVVDTSLNNVGNVALALDVDASTKIAGSFNTSSLLGRYGYPF